MLHLGFLIKNCSGCQEKIQLGVTILTILFHIKRWKHCTVVVFSLKAKTNTFRRKLATIARCDVLENISQFICVYHVETACLVCLDASSCTLYIDHCLIQIIIFVCQLFGNSYLSQILTMRKTTCLIFANSHDIISWP